MHKLNHTLENLVLLNPDKFYGVFLLSSKLTIYISLTSLIAAAKASLPCQVPREPVGVSTANR